jgi:hypothetical protein
MDKERNEFVYRANPNEWLEVSDELNESVEIIIKNGRTTYLKTDTWDGIPNKKLMSSRSILLLMGFAIENLIKGILIFDKPELVNQGKLCKEIISHKLEELVLKIQDINLNDDMSEFLKILSEAIPDWGRYPCPIKFQEIKDEVKYSKMMSKRYVELRRILRNKLIKRLKKGWISGLDDDKTNVKILSVKERAKQ